MTRKVVGRTFWDFLHDIWPTERGWVTIGMFALLVGLLGMARANPQLWDIEVFKVIIQAVFLTGLLNMILAFHFAANKGDEVKSENTGKALDAIKATAEAGTDTKKLERATQDVVDGATDARDEVLGSQSKGGISSDEETRT
jgi:hypothetical protein